MPDVDAPVRRRIITFGVQRTVICGKYCFRHPTGIAYDEESNIFYILDTVGRKIRTISMEEDAEDMGENENDNG